MLNPFTHSRMRCNLFSLVKFSNKKYSNLQNTHTDTHMHAQQQGKNINNFNFTLNNTTGNVYFYMYIIFSLHYTLEISLSRYLSSIKLYRI